MMLVDNSHVVLEFVPDHDDGDRFIYTEFIDREKGKTLPWTFYHRSKDEFIDQLSDMRKICETFQVRAYTRLSTKSWKKVGKLFAELVVGKAMLEDWRNLRRVYSSALGKSSPVEKYWLIDIDTKEVTELEKRMRELDLVLTETQSKAGRHLITRPFDRRVLFPIELKADLHFDNPTNLFIPK